VGTKGGGRGGRVGIDSIGYGSVSERNAMSFVELECGSES
jgi:hypothetical protein